MLNEIEIFRFFRTYYYNDSRNILLWLGSIIQNHAPISEINKIFMKDTTLRKMPL